MNISERKAELHATMTTARAEYDKIERTERKEKMVGLLGKYLKYPKNSYSLPQKPSDYWPVYRHVARMDRNGALHGVEFAKDSNGRVSVEPFELHHPEPAGWVPCTKREYERARDRIFETTQALLYAP